MVMRGELAPVNKIAAQIAWRAMPGPTLFREAQVSMETRVILIAQGLAPETVWLLEHPALYTAGTSAKREDLITPNRFPVFEVGRGGQYTYHGPGQRVAYVMLNLAKRGGDVRAFVATLEQWLINTLLEFDVQGERREDRVGIWVRHGSGESKIAAIGIRVRQGITFHGVSLNINPDLSHYDGIIPCGVSAHGVTSLAALNVKASMAEVDAALRRNFDLGFGATVDG